MLPSGAMVTPCEPLPTDAFQISLPSSNETIDARLSGFAAELWLATRAALSSGVT